MDRQIRRLALAVLGLFVILFIQVNYIQVFAADRLANDPHNNGQNLATLFGKAVITGGGTGVTYKDQNNTDTVQNTFDATEPRGKRTGSSILPP